MRMTSLVLAAAATLAVPMAAEARQTPQEKLDKLLAGRVAGKPVDCIDTLINRDSTVIDKTAIVYGSGRTIYVNRPKYPESLNDDDVLVTRLTSSRLCSVDTVSLHDRTGGWYRGFVGLSEFVPYTKVATADRH